MRVTFLGHACHLIECDGMRILTDPWLVDPAFGGLVEHGTLLDMLDGDLFPGVDVGPLVDDATCSRPDDRAELVAVTYLELGHAKSLP